MTATVWSGRRRFLLIAALFFAPMITAWVLYFGPADWKPQGGETQHGELQATVAPLDLAFANAQGELLEDPWEEKWTLLQIVPDRCDAACEARLLDMRQLRKSLHRRRDRVQRIVVLSSTTQAQGLEQRLRAEHPLLRFAVLAPAEHAAALAQINQGEPLAVALIDPLGNYVMRYPPSVELRGMYKDILRLLKLSNIG